MKRFFFLTIISGTMKSLLINFFSTLLLLIPVLVSGQVSFQEGYVVTYKNDTLKGEVARGISLGEIFKFKQQDKITNYSPQEIKVWGYTNGKTFSSEILQGKFTEILITGKLGLYLKNDILYLKKDTLLTDLQLQKRVIRTKEGGLKIKEHDQWRGRMLILMQDQPQMREIISQSDYGERELVRLVKMYNKASGIPFKEYKTKLPWVKVQFGARSGVRFSKIRVSKHEKSSAEYLVNEYSSPGISAAITMYITSPRRSKNLGVKFGLEYFSMNYSSSSEATTSFYRYDTNLSYSQLTAPIMVQYTLPLKQHAIYFGAGTILRWNNGFSGSYQQSYIDEITGKEMISSKSNSIPLKEVFPNKGYPIVFELGYLKEFNRFSLGGGLIYQLPSNKANTNVVAYENGTTLSLVFQFN